MHRVNRKTNIIRYLSSFKWSWIIITMAVFYALIKLSFWQYNRGVEKQQRLERIQQLNQQQTPSLAALLNANNHPANNNDDNLNDQLVTIDGYFVEPYVFLLDNQVDQGQTGYKVFSLFFDLSSEQHVLINMGWLKGSVDRNYLPSVILPKGKHTLTARIRLQSNGIMLARDQLQNNNWPLRVQQINSEKFSQLINKSLLPFSLILDKKETVGYKKVWQPIVMSPEKHFGYAMQWGLLSLAWLSLMLIASYSAYQRQRPE